jgi:hypothetical protein
MLPSFRPLLAAAFAEFDTEADPLPMGAADEQLAELQPCQSFVDTWLQFVQPLLLDDPSHAAMDVARPVASSAGTLSALAGGSRRLANALQQRIADDPWAGDALAHVQQLLLAVLQLQLCARVSHIGRSSGGAASADSSVWSVEDVCAFLHAFSPLLPPNDVQSLCSQFECAGVMEQLHRLFATATSSDEADAKLIEQMLLSNKNEQLQQCFQMIRRQTDARLALRFLRSCFQRTAQPASCLTHQLPLSLAIDLSVHLYPLLPPWFVAHLFDIRVSLFQTVSLWSRLTAVHDAAAAQLEQAPQPMAFVSAYLLAATMDGASQQTKLDRVAQQYHCYFHYLRSLINTHAVVRQQAPHLLLEYVRVCLSFDVPASLRVFRSRHLHEGPTTLHGAESTLVPARHSMETGVWVHEDAVLAIVSQPTVYAFDRPAMIRLFAQCGFFKGLLLLYQQQLELASSTALDLSARVGLTAECCLFALCADDPSSFTACIDSLVLSSSLCVSSRVRVWRYLLSHAYGLSVSPHAALVAPRALSVGALVAHLVDSIGAQLAVSLLLSEPTFIELCERGQLSSDFYASLLAHTVLRCQQATVSSSLLDGLDAYLWSDRPRSLARQVHATYRNEAQAGEHEEDEEDKHTRAEHTHDEPHKTSAWTREDNSDDNARGDGNSATSVFASRAALRAFAEHTSSPSHSAASLRRPSVSSLDAPPPPSVSLLFDYAPSVSSSRSSLCVSSSSLLPTYLEDLSTRPQWGVHVDLEEAVCAECTLKLMRTDGQTQTREQTMRIGNCGHLFHAACAAAGLANTAGNSCSVCFDAAAL